MKVLSPLAKGSQNKLSVFLIYVILAVAAAITFEQVRHNEFIELDDNLYVTANPQVKAGITYKSVIWAFASSHAANWHPLTSLSHMLDCELFGLNPGGHHLTSLLFHIANTLLLFWVLKRMTGAVWASGFVAAAFAIHPLHVESVAWVAERKDVLSGFFWMLTMAAYVRYTERSTICRYLLVVLALCLGLMAKPMLVTLPFVLVLLDYWPLNRLRWRHQGELPVRHLIIEKVPFFAVAAASSIVTYVVQQSWGAVAEMEGLPLNTRIANALVSYVSYIVKMVYPRDLAILYPHPVTGLPLWQPKAALLILAGVSAAVIYAARHRRYLAMGWLWYVGTLVPVIGLVQVGTQAMADRYTYLPSVGIFIMIGWGFTELFGKWRYRRIVLWTAAGIVLAVLLLCTRRQVRYWRNSSTLFEHTLSVTKNNFMIHNNYAHYLHENSLPDQAIIQFNKVLQAGPGASGMFSKAHKNLAIIYYEQGRLEPAIRHLTDTVRLEPDSANMLNDLAWILATTEETKFRDSTAAVKFAKRACELTSYEDPAFLDTLAAAYAAAGRFSEAIAAVEKSLEIAPSSEQKIPVEEIRDRLRLYRAGQAYTEPSPMQDKTEP